MLNEVKHLKVSVTVDGCAAREILHFVQDDIVGYQLIAMLNEVKHLKVSETVDGRAAREILHFVQDDIVGYQLIVMFRYRST